MWALLAQPVLHLRQVRLRQVFSAPPSSWRTIGPPTRTDLLADALDRRFFQGRTPVSLDAGCRFVINAANLITGTRFAFERDVLGDYVLGLTETADRDVRVATGVAASAAVPGSFAPVPVRGVEFPCGEQGGAVLVDGGAYDNTGLEAFDSQRYRDLFFMTLNAGGVFVTGPAGRTRFVRDLARANSLLYRQSTTPRTRWMVERFRAFEHARDAGRDTPEWGRQGVLVSLATEIAGTDAWRERHPEHRTWKGKDLAFVPTLFDRLDRALCRLLVYRGWWLIGAAMARYHPGVVDLRNGVTSTLKGAGRGPGCSTGSGAGSSRPPAMSGGLSSAQYRSVTVAMRSRRRPASSSAADAGCASSRRWSTSQNW